MFAACCRLNVGDRLRFDLLAVGDVHPWTLLPAYDKTERRKLRVRMWVGSRITNNSLCFERAGITETLPWETGSSWPVEGRFECLLPIRIPRRRFVSDSIRIPQRRFVSDSCIMCPGSGVNIDFSWPFRSGQSFATFTC